MRTFEQQLQEAVGCSYPLDIILPNLSADEILEEVNIFAKEVAKEALKNASENAVTKDEIKHHKADGIRRSGGSWREISVNKQSILNESNIPNI